ncbi:MAG: thiamine-monophosphate kinase [Verrucomicrobia bacterium]|nr:MAG: thiamine-monophosphate kinase [Verrucomicrobiota bacterium]
MLTENTSDQVGGMGEAALIREMLTCLGSAGPPPPHGPGDDCALLPAVGRRRLVTADPVIYKQHFLPQHSPRDVAAKLIRRNLSDIAAMGGRPEAAILSLSLPRQTSIRWLKRFFRALGSEAMRFEVTIIGGDCSESEGPPGFFMTMLGQAAGRRVLTRTGGRIGDMIYVTGRLGGSLLGRQFRFQPRLTEGVWLAGQRAVRSMIDLSDGMAKDLPELLPPGSAARLDAHQIPIARAAERRAKETGRPPLHHALHDGEDFELLFTVSGNTDLTRLERDWRGAFDVPLNQLGKIVPRSGSTPPILIDHAPDNFQLNRGYEHFR